ncbi:MAG: MDR/zinc-dependent alcohol dehydrogenase-like family protein [Planctomycetota bacterium]
MLALVYDQMPQMRDVRLPEPGPDEARVRVRLAGVCSTDLEVCKGYMGFTGVMGHEFVGTVEDGPAAWQHKRVVGEINCVCGSCELCRGGLGNHCPNRTVIGIDGRDGVFAAHAVVPVRNLHEVPETVSDEQAVFVEPLAAAFQIVQQVPIDEQTRMVVLGDGRLAQLIARVLKLTGGELLLVGKHAHKREAAEKAGVQTVALADYRPRKAADVVVDATGAPDGLALAMQAVRPRGTIVLKSTTAASAGKLNLAPLVIDEITVIGSRCGPFPDALDALARGSVDVSPLISRTVALRKAVDALDVARQRDVLKVLIDAR